MREERVDEGEMREERVDEGGEGMRGERGSMCQGDRCCGRGCG